MDIITNPPPFESIIGQNAICKRLAVSVNAVEGSPLANPCLFGPAGAGKTEIGLAYARAMGEKLDAPIWGVSTPQDLRTVESQGFQDWKSFLASSAGVFYIDEVHELAITPTRQTRMVNSYLLKALDAQNQGRDIPFTDDESFVFDNTRKVVIIMTNFPDKLMTNNAALISRMEKCNLSPYSAAEMQAITPRASRGTARPIYKMVEHFQKLGHETITTDLAVDTLSTLEMFPWGLTKAEMNLLNMVSVRAMPQNVIKASGLKLDADSIPYMLAPSFNTITKPASLITLETNGSIIATKRGNQLLKAVKDAGFRF
jgi:Holliday junction resolvasome RuvABC ATP-dependent DNA helicase subunit